MSIFVAVTIPLLIVSLYFYWNSENALRKKLLFDIESQSSYFLRNMEMEFERIGRMQRNLISDSNLNDLVNLNLYLNDFQRIVLIWNLQAKLADIKNSSDYIEDASIYIPSIKGIISSPGGGRYIYDALPDDFSERLPSMRAAVESRSPLYKEQLTLILPSQLLRRNPDEQPRYGYIIEATLSHSRIARSLTSLTAGDSDGFFLYDRQTGAMIASSGDAAIFPGLLDRWQAGNRRLQIESTPYFLIGKDSETTGLSLLGYTDEYTVLAALQPYRLWMWIGGFIFLLTTLIYTYSIQKYINQPVYLLLNHFRLLENGDLTTHIEAVPRNEFGVLYRQFNGMVDKLNSTIDQVYRQTIYSQRAELKQLQAQINPHFLYNSYFILHRLIKSGDPNATEFSRFLGGYFEYITENSADMVDLRDEVSHAFLYAKIQAMRFKDRINIEFAKLPPEMELLKVPKLILQPVLENAYLHGLEGKVNGGLLRVKFQFAREAHFICVSNNGSPIPDEELEKIRGTLKGASVLEDAGALLNIHRRLRLAFGESSGLEVTNSDGWVRVRLVIERRDEG
jgi:two-component system sensor histidine kinase YesM